jgi:hypothetical protein
MNICSKPAPASSAVNCGPESATLPIEGALTLRPWAHHPGTHSSGTQRQGTPKEVGHSI